MAVSGYRPWEVNQLRILPAMLFELRLTFSSFVSALVLVLALVGAARLTLLCEVKAYNSNTQSTDVGIVDYKSHVAAGHHPPEPLNNLRLILLGDSVTRYQYLSLAYFLRHGQWFDPDVTINNLVNSHSFHNALHPDEDWNEFFLQSNRMLYPMEVCDCLRSRNGEILLERRYFYDSNNNNMVVYINMNGNETHPGRGYYGRLNPREIYGNNFHNLVGLPFGVMMDTTDVSNDVGAIRWEYSTWGEVIRNHIGSLDLTFNMTTVGDELQPANAHVILNAGLHPHDFRSMAEAQELLDSLDLVGLPGTWKTTTYAKDYIVKHQENLLNFERSETQEAMSNTVVVSGHNSSMDHVSIPNSLSPHVRKTDTSMCQALGRCFNLSWMALLRPSLYFDNLHYSEPVYRICNEDFLDQLGQLPTGYAKLDRSTVLVDITATKTP